MKVHDQRIRGTVWRTFIQTNVLVLKSTCVGPKALMNSFELPQGHKTALIYASRNGHHDVVEELLNSGADVTLESKVRFNRI